jgi:hypothetical protein
LEVAFIGIITFVPKFVKISQGQKLRWVTQTLTNSVVIPKEGKYTNNNWSKNMPINRTATELIFFLGGKMFP